MKVIVVIADIVHSRLIVDRRAFQRRLEKTLQQLSAKNESLLSPYTITLGDEFQAVYSKPDRLFRDFFMLQRSLYPNRIRLVAGIGKLSTRINPRMSIGMDGPAFHRARAGILEAKQSGVLLRAVAEGTDSLGWIEPSMDLLSHVIMGWKRNRLEIMQRLLDGEETGAIARAMKLTPAGVYKNIQAGALNTVRELCAEMTRTLESRRKQV